MNTGLVGLVILIVAAGCVGQQKTSGAADCLKWLHGDNGYPDGYSAMLSQAHRHAPRLTSECAEAARAEIALHAQELIDLGRHTHPGGASGIFMEIAVHRWFLTTRAVAEHHASNWAGNDGDPADTQMGMYVFDQTLFEMAKRSWYTNVFMEKGSDIVRAPDVTFDQSVVGFQTYIVADQDRDGDDCATHHAKLEVERQERERKGKTLDDEIREFNSAGSTMTITTPSAPYVPPPRPQASIVTEFIDPHTIRISRKAKECKDGYAAMFVPHEWSIDLCNCTH